MQNLIEGEGEETRLPLTGCIQIIYPANNVNSLLPMLLSALEALNLPKHPSFIFIYPYAYFFIVLHVNLIIRRLDAESFSAKPEDLTPFVSLSTPAEITLDAHESNCVMFTSCLSPLFLQTANCLFVSLLRFSLFTYFVTFITLPV